MGYARFTQVLGPLLIAAIVFLSSTYVFCGGSDQQGPMTYRWQRVELEYPGDWKVDADADHNKTRNVRLIPKNPKYPVIVILTINPEGPAPDRLYQESPGLAALAFGNSIANQAAGNDGGGAAYISYGEIQLGDGPAATAHIIAPVKGGKKFASVQSFITLRNGYMVVGAVVMFGEEGRVVEDPTFHGDLTSAYAILRSLRIRPPKK